MRGGFFLTRLPPIPKLAKAPLKYFLLTSSNADNKCFTQISTRHQNVDAACSSGGEYFDDYGVLLATGYDMLRMRGKETARQHSRVSKCAPPYAGRRAMRPQ